MHQLTSNTASEERQTFSPHFNKRIKGENKNIKKVHFTTQHKMAFYQSQGIWIVTIPWGSTSLIQYFIVSLIREIVSRFHFLYSMIITEVSLCFRFSKNYIWNNKNIVIHLRPFRFGNECLTRRSDKIRLIGC